MHGLDKLGVCGVIPQGFAQLDDTVRQRVVANGRPWPQLRKELSLTHDLSGVLDQIAQHREGLLGQLQRTFATPELAIGKVESITIEAKHMFYRHFRFSWRRHATSSFPHGKLTTSSRLQPTRYGSVLRMRRDIPHAPAKTYGQLQTESPLPPCGVSHVR
jgi:hypothetical protein